MRGAASLAVMALTLGSPTSSEAATSQAIGLQLRVGEEVSAEVADDLSRRLAAKLQAVTQRFVRVDSGLWGQCEEGPACDAATRRRLDVSDLVTVQLFGAVTLLRVRAVRSDQGPREESQVDLQKSSPSAWDAKLDGLVRALFPEAWQHPVAQQVRLTPPPAASAERSLGPWVLMGAAGASLVAAIAVGALSRSARGAAEDAPTREIYESQADKTQRLAITADVLFAVSGAAALSGGLWWGLQ